MSQRSEIRGLPRAVSCVVPLLLALLVAPEASAQVNEADRGVARTYMAEGRALRDKHDLRGALARFRAAESLMHFPTTGYEVARTYADLGELLAARSEAQRVVAMASSPTDPPPFIRARERAAALLAEIDDRMPTIRIIIEGRCTALTLDGKSVDPDAAALQQPVDPGHHIILAQRDGHTVRREIQVDEKAELLVSIPLEVDSAVPLPRIRGEAPASTPGAIQVGEPSVRASSDRPWASRPMIVSFAIAGSGIVVGAVTGIVSLDETASAKGSCNGDRCPPSTQHEISSARGFANASNVAFIVGGAAALGAGVAWFLRPPRHAGSAYLAPWLGFGAAGVRGSF